MAERLGNHVVQQQLAIPPSEGKLRGILYKLNCIKDEYYDEQGICHLVVKLPKREWNRLVKQNTNQIEQFIVK